MSNIVMQAYYSAQAIASAVARSTNASDYGVAITIKATNDGMWYVIWTTKNGKMEDLRLLVSATNMERLNAHVIGFIQNIL